MDEEERDKHASKDAGGQAEEVSREPGLEDKLRALEAELAKAQAEVADKHDKHLRAAAELSNYRKRVQKEREDLMRLAREDLVLKLVDVLDNFDRALQAAKTMSDFDAFHKGVEFILKQMGQTLEREGLVPFCSKGQPFDPTRHEAVFMVETEKHPPWTVVEEISRGYSLRDKVVRPALVTVSKEKSKAETTEKPEAEPAEAAMELSGDRDDEEEELSTE
jgi:molecular chaperone GrpE